MARSKFPVNVIVRSLAPAPRPILRISIHLFSCSPYLSVSPYLAQSTFTFVPHGRLCVRIVRGDGKAIRDGERKRRNEKGDER